MHTKAMVIDPFTDRPVVITGSPTLEAGQRSKNDVNFLIIRDDPPLAEAHAVHIVAAYDHYRFRAVQESPWPQPPRPSKARAFPHTGLDGPQAGAGPHRAARLDVLPRVDE